MNTTVRLAVFIEDGLDVGQRELLERELRNMPQREWCIAEPLFAWADLDDEEEEDGDDDDVFEPAGGVYTLLPAADAPPALDRKAFEDARALIAWATNVAQEHHLHLSVEYAEEVIGEIGPNGPDTMIAEGLLAAWESMTETTSGIPD